MFLLAQEVLQGVERASSASSDLKKYTKKTPCIIQSAFCFNLFSFSYKAVGREQKFLYFRSKLGLPYNIVS